MDRSIVAGSLRWLAVLWIVVWAFYVTLWDNSRLSTVEGTLRALATLVIPAVIAFGLSWALERGFGLVRQHRQERSPE